jgi:protein-S-isoprenylcysteine O-methyltransferase Ste14
VLHEIAIATFLVQWLYWAVAAARTSAQAAETGEQAAPLPYRLHTLVVTLAIVANCVELPGLAGARVLARPRGLLIAGFVLVMCGVTLAVAARVHLGRNWSGAIQKREGQQVVRSGPYAYVRHPIYTAILTSLLGLFLMMPQLAGLVGLVAACASYRWKVGREEEFLRSEFGEEYEVYMRESGRLLPRIR